MCSRWVPSDMRAAKAPTALSAPGPDSSMARQQWFSLIEVLMVLLIIGIATTTVSGAAFTRSDARKLRLDANRLAQLFAVAQAQARTAGRPVVWIYDTQGYRFAH